MKTPQDSNLANTIKVRLMTHRPRLPPLRSEKNFAGYSRRFDPLHGPFGLCPRHSPSDSGKPKKELSIARRWVPG